MESDTVMDYDLEDIHAFLTRRPFLVGGGRIHLMTESQFQLLLARKLTLRPERVNYIRAFIDGWLRAKE
jgi:hypothetical protein